MNKSIFSLLFCLGFSTLGKTQVKDAGLWTEIQVGKKFTPRFELALTDGSRLNQNYSHYRQHYTQLSSQYRFNPDLSLTVAYRYAQVFEPGETSSSRHRIHFDLNARHKYHKTRLELQFRYQSQLEDPGRSPKGNTLENKLRAKLGIDYDLDRKIEPFCSAEIFLNLRDAFADNLRFKGGLNYEPDDYQRFSIYYMLDQEIQVTAPVGSYILGLGYQYSF